MSLPRFAFLGVLSLCTGVAAACGSTVANNAAGTTTGSGGTGGAGSSTTTTTTTGTGAVDAGVDADNGMPSTTYPAPLTPPPQVVDYNGPVLAMPRIVPVFFAGDDPAFQAQLEDFVSKVGSTAYWTAAVGEYGVGPATALPPVQLTETAPATIDDTAIQTWLQGKLNGDDPLWPANDANTVYALHYPSATTITSGGQSSCTAFGGYHSDTQLDVNHGSAYVAYAVIPRCMSFPPLVGIDAVTGAESHELAEAVTDPYPMDQPAYVTVDDPHYYWARLLGGGEVGDMCAQFENAFTKFTELDYTVQRIWSNKAAKAGHDPCQPTLPGSVYFNATPVLTDSITVMTMGAAITVKGVKIDLGETKTIDVELFSDAATSGPFTVTAENASQNQQLKLVLDKSSGVNGEKLHLSITVLTAGKRGTENFILKSSLGGQDNIWIGIVGTPVATDAGTGPGGPPGMDGG
jgi:hypothetical protein